MKREFDTDAASRTVESEHQTSSVSVAAPHSTEDPFDPTRLRLSQDFGTELGIRKLLLTVPVRKPDKQWFVRVHPDPANRLETAVLEMREDRETYLVDRPLWCELSGEITPKLLVTAINRQGVVFLWPVRLPGLDGRLDAWNQSGLQAQAAAKKHWVRVTPNLSLGAYEVSVATVAIAEPAWPDLPFPEVLRVAFKDRFIQSLDHPIVQRLRGER